MQVRNLVLRWLGPALAVTPLFLIPAGAQAAAIRGGGGRGGRVPPRTGFTAPPGTPTTRPYTFTPPAAPTTRPWTSTRPAAPTFPTQPSYPGYTPNYGPGYAPPTSTPGYAPPGYGPTYAPTVPPNTGSAPSNAVTAPAATPTPPPNVVGNVAPPAQARPNKVSQNVGFGLTADLKGKVTRDLKDFQGDAQQQVQTDLGGYLINQDQQDQLVQEALQKTGSQQKANALAQAFAGGQVDQIAAAMDQAGFSQAKVKQTITAVQVTQEYNAYQNALADGSPDDIARATQQLQTAFDHGQQALGVGNGQRQQQDQKFGVDLGQRNAAQQAGSLLAGADTSGQAPSWGMAGDSVVVVSCPDLPPGQVDVAGPDLVLTGATGQPGTSVSTESLSDLGVPLVAGQPVHATDADFKEGDIVLSNPDNSGGAVSYVVGQQTFSMQPGFVQALPAGHSWTITFDRGGSFGQAEYRLDPGRGYEFRQGQQGWDLFEATYRATIDNSANPNPFHYLRGTEEGQAPARQQVVVTGNTPVLLVFDPGDGKPVRRMLFSDTYRVGLNPQTGLLDLFKGKPAAGAAASASPDHPHPAG